MDWAAREAAFERDAADVPDEVAAHAWLRVLLDELGDGHSHVWSHALLEELRERDPESPRAKVATARRVRCAHVVVPSYVHGNRHLSDTGFAHRLLALIEAADGTDPDGWVIDLRDNGGGDMWPMLAGLAPLLDGPVVGCFRDGEDFEERWRIDVDGSLYCGDHPCIDLGRPLPALSRGARRSPCSRVLARAAPARRSSSPSPDARGRADSVSRPSGCLRPTVPTSCSTARSFLLTTSVFVDRDGTAYGERIVPDEQVLSVEGCDTTLEAACRWLGRAREAG